MYVLPCHPCVPPVEVIVIPGSHATWIAMVDDYDLFPWYLILQKYLPDKMLIVLPTWSVVCHVSWRSLCWQNTPCFWSSVRGEECWIAAMHGGGFWWYHLRTFNCMTMATPASSDNLNYHKVKISVCFYSLIFQQIVHAVTKRRLHTHKQKFSALAVSSAAAFKRK